MDYTKLVMAGIDMDDLMKRLMNNSELLGILIKKFIADENYNNLTKAIENNDIKAAETAAHTLKGMCGNMSLKKLFDLFQTQLKLLRSDNYKEAVDMMSEIALEYENAVNNMKLWLDENK